MSSGPSVEKERRLTFANRTLALLAFFAYTGVIGIAIVKALDIGGDVFFPFLGLGNVLLLAYAIPIPSVVALIAEGKTLQKRADKPLQLIMYIGIPVVLLLLQKVIHPTPLITTLVEAGLIAIIGGGIGGVAVWAAKAWKNRKNVSWSFDDMSLVFYLCVYGGALVLLTRILFFVALPDARLGDLQGIGTIILIAASIVQQGVYVFRTLRNNT